jgi:hypothetical protein
MIKRPYIGRMAFWPDEPERTVEVVWQYAHPNAADMPFAHAFVSSRWDDTDRDDLEPWGEVSTRSRGRFVEVSPLEGAGPCGDVSTWRHGADEDTPLLSAPCHRVPLGERF